VFHAGPVLFHTGWFVESLATQTLVIFVVRTRRIPFFHSRPSVPLLLAALAVVIVGAVLPFTPLGHLLGFRPLPGLFFLALAGIVVCYLVLIEVGKYWFYRFYHAPAAAETRHRTAGFRVHRRAARFTTHTFHPAPGRKPARHQPARPASTAPAR
jgi:P-type Mg2+ transporter